MTKKIEIIGLETIPEILPGDDIAEIILRSCKIEKVPILDNDIIVITSKIISKAEGRIIDLKKIIPSEKALKLSVITKKDPRLVELILRESDKILKALPGHIITLTKNGLVCANAGIDRSNVAGSSEIVILLPKDPDRSARIIGKKLENMTGKKIGIVITDTYGRPFRNGQVDMAIGVYNVCLYKDYRGTLDLKGYRLRIKKIALIDEIAAAAELVKGNGAEGIPIAIIRGLEWKNCRESQINKLYMKEERWFFK
ncbi:MAG: coenzyme F420-0:L-glutamate ligase [Thermoproteales archaeon]|nr:coenzyme F420-0:L-glutamate ligase [Thermoproteales archaeon]